MTNEKALRKTEDAHVKIRGLLVTCAVSFLVLIGFIAMMTGMLFSSGGSDALYINLAGRQRMLSQKLSKEVLLYTIAPSAAGRDQVESTAELFDRTHNALIRGGSVPLGPNLVLASAATDAELLRKLNDVGMLWNQLNDARKNILKLYGTPGGEAAGEVARRAFVDLNPELLKTMDEAVTIAQRVSEAKLETLKTVQIGAIALGIILVVVTIILASSIGATIASLQAASDLISTGRANEAVRATGVGELKELCASFERMRVSLNMAMSELRGRS